MLLNILELLQTIDNTIAVKCDVTCRLDNAHREPSLVISIGANLKESRYGLERAFTVSELKLKIVGDDCLIKEMCNKFNDGYRKSGG